MPLYFAQFVVIEENIWGPPYSSSKGRRTETCRIHTQLFSASDADSAHARAQAMVQGFSDANNDGPGDRTNYWCKGIVQLEEVVLGKNSLQQELEDHHGIDVGVVSLDEKWPGIPTRELLSVFQVFPWAKP